LVKDCDVLILRRATRGIDVGAKQISRAWLNELAAQGRSISMISSESARGAAHVAPHRRDVARRAGEPGVLEVPRSQPEAVMLMATQSDPTQNHDGPTTTTTTKARH
jgi:hypothetical protein